MRAILPCVAFVTALLWMPLSASAQEAPTWAPGAFPTGSVTAAHDLFAEGYRHLTGQGFHRDATRAAACFLGAARMGEPQAQF